MMWAKIRIKAPKKAATVRCTHSVIIKKITPINIAAAIIAGNVAIVSIAPPMVTINRLPAEVRG
jgi:hypothetical protein